MNGTYVNGDVFGGGADVGRFRRRRTFSQTSDVFADVVIVYTKNLWITFTFGLFITKMVILSFRRENAVADVFITKTVIIRG
jgi:hypothetical protein